MSLNSVTPLNSLPEAGKAPEAPPRLKRRRIQPLPKLTTAQLTAASAISSLVAVGRATSLEHQRSEGHRTHASLLSAVVRRATRWTQTVAPRHSLSQFVVEARALSGNRALRAYISNVRLAQLRGADEGADGGGGEAHAGGSADTLLQPPMPDPGASGPMPAAPMPEGAAIAADVPDELEDGDGWDEPDGHYLAAMETSMHAAGTANVPPHGSLTGPKGLQKQTKQPGKNDSNDWDEPDEDWFAAMENTINSKLAQGQIVTAAAVFDKAATVSSQSAKTSKKRRIIEDDDDDDDDDDVVGTAAVDNIEEKKATPTPEATPAPEATPK